MQQHSKSSENQDVYCDIDKECLIVHSLALQCRAIMVQVDALMPCCEVAREI